MRNLSIDIVGLGGIGTMVSDKICQFLQYYQARDENFAREMGIEEPPTFDSIDITLIDGDVYESRNRARQDFRRIGPKAEVKEEELRDLYDRLNFRSVCEYITGDSIDETGNIIQGNISDYIKDGHVVLVCVDNHESRKIINEYCQTLQNIILICGGNKFHTASTQRYIRRDGVDIRPNITKFHPEIARAIHGHPGGLSCEEQAVSEPQLIFANWGSAFAMAIAFYTEVILNINTEISDSYIDILTGQILSKKYPV